MEKNKAIQLLERLQDPEPYEPMLTKDAYDAIQMAIDALSTDGDTISRTSLMSELKDMHHEAEKWIADAKDDDVKARAESCLVTITEIKLRVDKMPSVQPEQFEPNQNGDLWITVPDIDKVTRIFVQEGKSKFCRIFCEEQEQPEPYAGHWVNGYCDKCNEHAPFWAMASTYHESNFCPNCGAEMRGEGVTE